MLDTFPYVSTEDVRSLTLHVESVNFGTVFRANGEQLGGEKRTQGGGRETSKGLSTGDFALTDATILLVEVVSSEVRGRKQMLL